MKKIFKIWNTLRDTLSPLPTSEGVLSKYWGEPLYYLHSYQIREISSLILEQAKISRGYGLFLRPEDLDKEILFWLVFVNFHAGIVYMRKNLPYELAIKLAGQAIDHEFLAEKKVYFEEIQASKTKIINTPNAFQVHLEAVQAAVLSAIYNNTQSDLFYS